MTVGYRDKKRLKESSIIVRTEHCMCDVFAAFFTLSSNLPFFLLCYPSCVSSPTWTSVFICFLHISFWKSRECGEYTFFSCSSGSYNLNEFPTNPNCPSLRLAFFFYLQICFISKTNYLSSICLLTYTDCSQRSLNGSPYSRVFVIFQWIYSYYELLTLNVYTDKTKSLKSNYFTHV